MPRRSRASPAARCGRRGRIARRSRRSRRSSRRRPPIRRGSRSRRRAWASTRRTATSSPSRSRTRSISTSANSPTRSPGAATPRCTPRRSRTSSRARRAPCSPRSRRPAPPYAAAAFSSSSRATAFAATISSLRAPRSSRGSPATTRSARRSPASSSCSPPINCPPPRSLQPPSAPPTRSRRAMEYEAEEDGLRASGFGRSARGKRSTGPPRYLRRPTRREWTAPLLLAEARSPKPEARHPTRREWTAPLISGRSPKPEARSPLAAVIRGPRGSGRRARRASHRAQAYGGRGACSSSTMPAAGRRREGARTRSAVALMPNVRSPRRACAMRYVYLADPPIRSTTTVASSRLEHARLRSPRCRVSLIASATSTGAAIVEPRRPPAARRSRCRAWSSPIASPRGPPLDRRGDAAARARPAAVELAGRYVIGPGAIADVVAEASRYADAAAGTPLDIAALEASRSVAASPSAPRLVTAASSHRKARFAELVLPDDVIDTMRDMVAMVRERSKILETLGLLQRHLGISRGVSGLFSGEPGTGKTMAASVIASELGLEPCIRIDSALSAVVSKYKSARPRRTPRQDLRRGAGRARDAPVRRSGLCCSASAPR